MTVGLTVVLQGCLYFLDGHNGLSLKYLIGLTSSLSGALLLVGYLTPLAGVLATLSSIARVLSSSALAGASLLDSRLATAFEVAVAIALVCIGPGAFSLDSRVFGRREIIIPRSSPPPE